MQHTPVLLAEVTASLALSDGGVYIDGTLGYGGHAEKMLEMSGPSGRLIGIDRDLNAIESCRKRLATVAERVCLREGSYADIPAILTSLGVGPVDGILLDLGISSPQLDRGEYGISFKHDGPLDMRMGRSVVRSAEEVVNSGSSEDLADIIYYYGEERKSRRVASAIVEQRKKGRISTTGELASIVRRAVGRSGRIDPATRTFQALRIYVNDELQQLESFFDFAFDILNEGGRVCVITYHSLEDRIVKLRLREAVRGASCSNSGASCSNSIDKPAVQLVNKKPIVPGREEILSNRRARSAKLRVAVRL